MNTILKRVISLVLCLVLVAGYVPTGAFAEETGETVATVTTEAATEPTGEAVEETEPTGEAVEETEAEAAEATEPDSSIKSMESAKETVSVTEPSTVATVPSAEVLELEVIAVTGITLDRTTVEVGVGELPMTLVATVLPENAADKTVTWTSSEPGVVSVENGVLTFGYMGEAVITATAGEFSASCTVTVGEGERDTYEGGTVVIAGSDYQKKDYSSPETNVKAILAQIKQDYPAADGFIFGGDYSQSTSSNATESGKEELQGVVQDVYGENLNEIYVQGNHDPDNCVTSGILSASGAHDTGDYGVYVINEKDYPWGYGANDTTQKSTIQSTADALDAYLDAKAEKEYSKPIFVASHLPLHFTSRTASQGDGKYAKYIYDVLDEAGDKGLNIIFLFGHNHSSGYDAYLGNGSIYLAEGKTITIAKEGSSSEYYTDTLSFTYMNCGYVGYVGGSADTELTMTVFEITDDQVTVSRYNDEGVYTLKAAGVTSSGNPTADTSTVASGEVIELNQFKAAAAITGITVTAPAKTAYVVGDALDTTGMVVTASYDDGSTKDVTGYEVSADLTSAGIKTVTVTYQEKTATFEITVYAPVKDETIGVTVAAPGVTGLTVAKVTEEVPEGTDYSAYVSYDINPEGYTSGAATVTVPVPASFDAGKPVMVLDGDSVLTTTTIVNGTVTFTATHFSVYAVAQAAESALDWQEIPGGIVYQLDTDGLTAGTKYLIVNTSANGSGVALRNAGGEEGTTNVTISGGTIILEADTDVAWTPNSATSGHFENQGEYLRLNGSDYDLVTGSSTTLVTSKQSNGAYTISANVSGGGWWGSSSATYYLAYNNGWESTTSASNVYLYECKGAGNGGYAAMTGTTVYNVVTDTTNAAALEAQIRSNLVVYTAADANGTNQAATTEYTLSGTVDPTKAGTYTYTVTYGGVALGTVTVYVNDVAINSISVAPASGVVTVGASDSALVGATITVDVDGGEDFTVPVTVSMLSGEFNTAVADTYTNLTVTYGGKTYTGFTLTVKEKVVNNYPSYPNEGAVKVDKKATGIDFQKTGVARVELMTSGIPMNQGVDVLLVLDTSSSMGMQGSLTDNRTRIDVLKECVNALIAKLQKPHADGSEADIDIAVVHFNGYTGNKNTNYIGSTARSTSTLGGQLTNGFVDVQTLDEDWASNIPDDCSGTNYDHGLLQAYDLLKQRQRDNGDNIRKQFVLFMSDGAPFQYNGVNSNSLSSDWENWILGSYTLEQVEALSHVNNPEFYFGNNNGQGQKHRVAEAIKGASTNKYQIVTYSDTSSTGTTKLEEVSGLGATMYSVGLALEGTNMPTDVAGQEAILKTIASSEDLFYSVTSAAGLQGAFDDFAGAILYAAENAVFEDKLGANFNIQMANTTVRTGTDGKVFDLNPDPTMEVREYTIWTREELEDANGNLSEANAKKVGTRKTDASGNYIYKPLEVVSFNAAGTEAYTGDSTNNIMVNGVINANTFWYNNGTTTVKIDVDGDGTAETDLDPETFIWKVGTIKTTELALSYYVYLDDSLEGEASAGSYDTNTYAILTYDNYLGNPCHKDTVSPSLAWLSANVSYAYYLVNEAGQPVNANGEVVTFANREIIVDPTLHSEIPLNSEENWVGNLAVASTGVLDDGNYSLFDYDAKYQITVNSDATGAWSITVGTKTIDGTTTTLPATTYVTGFSDTESFSNVTATSSDTHDGYDYTHTTVWFAVVWEPDALDDTVVIDYGLPVDVHVLTNDFFGDFGTLIGVAKGEVTDSDGSISTNEIPASTTPVTGEFGTAQVIKPDTGANESNSVIRYELDSMEMDAPEVFTYSVDYTNTKLHNNNGFYYGKLTVIPATTIYYEDSFLNLASYTKATDGSWPKDENEEYGNDGKWEPVGTAANGTQDEDRPGDINFAFDTIIDANNVYGNDSAYETMSTYSLGSARKITVDESTRGEATFTFYGTGFDVIGLTSNATGTITVKVYKGAEVTDSAFKTTAVDTYYGYVFESKDMDGDGAIAAGEGEWVISANDPNALYQVPVMKISGLDYGQYTVKITAGYSTYFDHTSDAGYELYLDAIRIYDPTGNLDETANDAYVADGEGWPIYQELRNNIIAASNYSVTENADGTVTVTGADLSGAIFIDCNNETSSIADYVSYGPNNELYLAEDQAVAFNVNVPENVADVQLGIKVGNGGSVTYEINGDSYTVNTATDMYYSILDYAKAGTVTIRNTSGGILSLTNIKVTHKSAPANESGINLLSMDAESVGYALMRLRPVVEEEIPETTAPDASEPEPSEPEETVPEEPVSTRLQSAVDAAKQLQEKDYTQKSFKAFKTALKSAEKVLKDKKATEAKLEAALEALNAAVAALEARPDTAALQSAVDAAKKLKEKDYTAVSYKAVTTARKAAEKLLKDKNATQAKVDAALEALNAAVAALEAKADTSALKSAVNAAKKLKEKDYTVVSYKAVTAARKAAEKVMKDKNANQAAADAALEALNAAVSALEARANTAALKSAVNAAKKLKSKNYTAESFQVLTTARKAAEKLMKDKNANQAMADEALAALNEAMDALVAKPGKN